MVTLSLAILLPVLAAVSLWVWYCRDSGTHDQPPFGRPRFTDDERHRAERS